MSKAYSNKALPAGTVLREWRLEEVLGVGGFGIVYKGRGIYFDELVAIKEYFPSSISEREADDTVVPIDSDAEEVHALGLKKFVEEAKLLWNLSTPSRHPNIVSVRSLFEIHGTAYMVMDFEDGIALSRELKKGAKFNERSLWNIIHPIAEGLERAHRVGVLHRDIKPPNILINEDGRPVLIDFGSARFEAAEATSTKVTFHTPPYAAIEQYVKTYPQGPWTDIYALGVVLYECVTGEKPPEVLERMHAGLGKPLADGSWPGYSKKFLAAIDAAMTIRPQERPQSISAWLEMFGKNVGKSKTPAMAEDDDATRVFTHELKSDSIVPVAPPVFADGDSVETQVPDHPDKAIFKGAGQETGAKKKVTRATVAAAAAGVGAAALAAEPEIAAEPVPEPEVAGEEPVAKKAAEPKKATPKHDAVKTERKSPSPALLAGAAAVVIAAGAGAWALFGGGGSNPSDALPATEASASGVSAGLAGVSQLAPATKALADDATKAGISMSAISGLTAASDQLAQQYQALQGLPNDPASQQAVAAREDEMRQLATRATGEFATALLKDVEAKAQRLSAAVPWANPNGGGRAPSADQQQVAGDLRTSYSQLKSAVDAATKATSPTQAIEYARMALSQSQNFTSASLVAYNKQQTAIVEAPVQTAQVKTVVVAPVQTRTVTPTRTTAAPTARTAATTAVASSATTLSPGKIGQLNSIVDDGRSMAKSVMRMGRGSGSTPQNTQALRANAALAKTYDASLAQVKAAGRGVSSDRDADRLIAQAKQTRAYVQFLVRQSTAASR